jgi:hypothetical protein
VDEKRTRECIETLVAAIEAGRAEDALEERHLRRMERLAVDGESIVFVVERHPSLDGRPTKGRASPAFRTLRVTYRYRQGRIAVEGEEDLGVSVDVDQLAKEDVESYLDACEVDADFDPTKVDPAAVPWLMFADDFGLDLPLKDREPYRRRCTELLRVRLVGWSSSGNNHVSAA